MLDRMGMCVCVSMWMGAYTFMDIKPVELVTSRARIPHEHVWCVLTSRITFDWI